MVGKYRPAMGMHSKPKVGYLPKVAAGAAPFALLIAGPATAWAAEPSLPQLVDHQHSGSFGKDLSSGTTDLDSGASSFVNGFIAATESDTYLAELGDGTVQEISKASGRAHTANTAVGSLAVDTAHGPAGLISQEVHQLSTSVSRYDAVRLPDGSDLIGEFSESPQLGLSRTTTLTGDRSGAIHPVAGLGGNAGLGHTSGYAVDVGDLVAFGTSSEQGGSGSFTGLLDLARGADGMLTSTVTDGVDAAVHQSHAVGGHLGPVSTDTSWGQAGKAGCRGSLKSLLWGDGKSTDESTTGCGISLNSTAEQNLGVDHVFHIDAGLATGATAAGGVTELAKNGLPAMPVSTQNASASQDGHLSVQLLDKAPFGGGLHLAGPPLTITPR
jgi:hypothetical protein